MSTQKISFWGAVVININIVIGAAFFLNAQTIQVASGVYAPLLWLMCGLLLAPLVAILAQLAARYPSDGGIYVYSEKILGRFWGFLSSWGYFIGTVAGNAVVVRAFSRYVQQVGFLQPLIHATGLPEMVIDLLVVFIFAFLNLMNVQFLERVQMFFTVLKLIPFILLIGGLVFLWGGGQISPILAPVDLSAVFTVFSPVLFGYIGIEACCAVMSKIDDTKYKPAHVLWVSFSLIILAYALLQAAIFLIFGQQNVNPFLSIASLLTHNQLIIEWINRLVYAALLCSFLGGFYGLFYYNNWNLYVLARDKILIGDAYLTKLNKNQVPWVCVLVQTLLLVLFLSSSSDPYLMIISGFGGVLAYFLSAFAYVTLQRSFVGFLALVSCSILLYLTMVDLFQAGFLTLIPFLISVVVGLLFYRREDVA